MLQRGQAAAFANLMMLGGTLAGNGLGYLTGVGVLSQEMAYWVLIVLNIVDIPLGMMGVGVSPGWWSPERPAEEPPAGASGSAGGGDGVVAAAARWTSDFFSPFWRKDAKSFRWWFYFTTVQTSAQIVGQTFLMYWLQDEVAPHGFLFAGHVPPGMALSDSSGSGAESGSAAQAALSLGGLAGSIASTATSVLGGCGPCDRARRTVIALSSLAMAASAAALTTTHSFTVYLVLQVVIGLLTGLAAAPMAALGTDVLPAESDDPNTAKDPARDANLFTLAQTIPSTVLPIPFGNALPDASQPAKRAAAYRMFFWTQAALTAGSLWMVRLSLPLRALGAPGVA